MTDDRLFALFILPFHPLIYIILKRLTLLIKHASDSRPIATDSTTEIPSKPNPKRVSFKEKLAQKKKEADLFNREHTSRKTKNLERTFR